MTNLRRKLSLTLLAGLAILMIALLPKTALVAQNATEDPLSFDAQGYATLFGITTEEALSRFALQDLAGQLDAALAEGEEDTFAGLWLEHSPNFKVVVRFTGDGEQTIESYTQSSDLADILELRTAEVSLAELKEVQVETLSSITDAGIAADFGINVKENRIEVYVTDQGQIDVPVSDGKLVLSPRVQVVEVEKLSLPAVDIYGGLALNPVCTSGFGVIKSDGTKGIASAGHCANTQSYMGTSLTFEEEEWRTFYDVQWYTTPGFTVTNEIQWSNDGSTRAITSTKSRASQSIGEYVCKYGKITGYTCGFIGDKNISPNYVPNAASTFIRVEDSAGYSPLVESGDSGGPFFLGYTAYGVVSGKVDTGKAIYMAADYVYPGLGVDIMTAP